jgi:hypothetical protein
MKPKKCRIPAGSNLSKRLKHRLRMVRPALPEKVLLTGVTLLVTGPPGFYNAFNIVQEAVVSFTHSRTLNRVIKTVVFSVCECLNIDLYSGISQEH